MMGPGYLVPNQTRAPDITTEGPELPLSNRDPEGQSKHDKDQLYVLDLKKAPQIEITSIY